MAELERYQKRIEELEARAKPFRRWPAPRIKEGIEKFKAGLEKAKKKWPELKPEEREELALGMDRILLEIKRGVSELEARVVPRIPKRPPPIEYISPPPLHHPMELSPSLKSVRKEVRTMKALIEQESRAIISEMSDKEVSEFLARLEGSWPRQARSFRWFITSVPDWRDAIERY